MTEREMLERVGRAAFGATYAVTQHPHLKCEWTSLGLAAIGAMIPEPLKVPDDHNGICPPCCPFAADGDPSRYCTLRWHELWGDWGMQPGPSCIAAREAARKALGETK